MLSLGAKKILLITIQYHFPSKVNSLLFSARNVLSNLTMRLQGTEDYCLVRS